MKIFRFLENDIEETEKEEDDDDEGERDDDVPMLLFNDHIVAWVTRSERPKGAKDKVKPARRAPKLLVHT